MGLCYQRSANNWTFSAKANHWFSVSLRLISEPDIESDQEMLIMEAVTLDLRQASWTGQA